MPPRLSDMEKRHGNIKETDRKATGGMLRFVVTILVIALLLAGAWLLLFRPGDPEAIVGSLHPAVGAATAAPAQSAAPRS